MHKARDLDLEWEVDRKAKVITLRTEWVDTQLLKWWMQIHQPNAVNGWLERAELPLLKDLRGFSVKLIVDNKATFDVTVAKSEIEREHDTLVMRLI